MFGGVPIVNLRQRILDDVWRALYGEVTDPSYTAARTTEVQTSILAKAALFQDMYQQGRNRWWWEYLRLSKDYWLVCQTSERGAVKTDDQQLRRVYRGFGDIYSCTFDEWWLERGYRLFTEQEKFPKVVEVQRRPSERKRQVPAEDKIWVEVPLKLSRRTIQKQLGKLLDEY
jgi:hypothetical protein